MVYHVDTYFKKHGFEKCPDEPTLFAKHGKVRRYLITSLYVDDLMYTSMILI